MKLTEITELLALYCRGLTGLDLRIRSIRSLVGLTVGWSSTDGSATDGTTIYLPEKIEVHEEEKQNFDIYKVLAIHQVGHLEFGTFQFSFEKPAARFADLRPDLAKTRDNQMALTDYERFFDLLPDRVLARDIFTAVEDCRVDYRLLVEYPGVRRGLARVQFESLQRRPTLETLPQRQALVECLIQMSLWEGFPLGLNNEWFSILSPVFPIIDRLQSREATVEDAVEATIRLYFFISSIPNVRDINPLSLLPYVQQELQLQTEPIDRLAESFARRLETQAGRRNGIELHAVDRAKGLPYASPNKVEFRGGFKPELVQTILGLKDGHVSEKAALMAGSLPAMVKQTLHKSVEVEADVGPHILEAREDLLLRNIRNVYDPEKHKGSAPADAAKYRKGQFRKEPQSLFHYHEWDYRRGLFIPDWCVVKQQNIGQGSEEFFEATQRERRQLLKNVARQFERLRSPNPAKMKRLQDGEEYDLDAGIELLAERRAGVAPSDKIYIQRRKANRGVAVLFLLDLSGSTAELVKDGDQSGPSGRLKTIIDVEKESLVIMTAAMEAVGDRYSIYGFSGYGRQNVLFLAIKEFDEKLSGETKRRFGAIRPFHATRMGPAIRHATAILEDEDARLRLIFLLSDGRPGDKDYGVGPESVEVRPNLLGRLFGGRWFGDRQSTVPDGDLYALHDTRMALLEAKKRGIVPFCLTVDRFGRDYMAQMCAGVAHEVLDSIESLPKRLPKLYRTLAA